MRKFSNNLLPTENEKSFFLNDTAVKKNKTASLSDRDTNKCAGAHFICVLGHLVSILGRHTTFIPSLDCIISRESKCNDRDVSPLVLPRGLTHPGEINHKYGPVSGRGQ